jgi:hypothetical protein
LTPPALRPYVERVDLKVLDSMRLLRPCIRRLHDAAVPPAKAAENAARLRATPIDLDAAHDPPLSVPDGLARILDTT